MNERIRLLAEQARIYFDRRNDLVGEVSDLERFAELLIKECITVINQPNGVGDDDVIRISQDVEKHFGVEE